MEACLDLLCRLAAAPESVRLGQLDARELCEPRERRQVVVTDLAARDERRERAGDLVTPDDRRREQGLRLAPVAELQGAVLDLLGRPGLYHADQGLARRTIPTALRDVVRHVRGEAGLAGKDNGDAVEAAERREVRKARRPEVGAGPAAQTSPFRVA